MENTISRIIPWTNAPLKVFDALEGLCRSGFSSKADPFHSAVSTIANGLEKLNMDLDTNILTLDQIKEVYSYLRTSPLVVRTPVLAHVQSLFIEIKDKKEHSKLNKGIQGNTQDLSKVDLSLKMENMQTTGSFKIRGVVNQLRKVREKHGKESKLVTMSAGNYGKAFAKCVGKSSHKSVCIMPKTAPSDRIGLIESMGVEVRTFPTSELQAEVDKLVSEEDFVFCHPFDDVDLMAGYASSALELLEEIPDPDVVLVCCGGGGLVSGVAAAISLSGLKNCRVYAVEPEGAPTMHESFKKRRPITLPNVKSVAAGLSPPYAGSSCYKHCCWFLEDILLVTDQEILDAMRLMFQRGMKVEPSGSAAMAAVLSGKVPNIEGKKVVVYVTGSNVSCSQLIELIPETS